MRKEIPSLLHCVHLQYLYAYIWASLMQAMLQEDNLNCPSKDRKRNISLAWHLYSFLMHERLVLLHEVTGRCKWKKYILYSVIRKMWKQKCQSDRLSSAFSHFWDLTASNWSYIIIRLESFAFWECNTHICRCFNKEKNSSPSLHLGLSFLVSLINVFCCAKVSFNCVWWKFLWYYLFLSQASFHFLYWEGIVRNQG